MRVEFNYSGGEICEWCDKVRTALMEYRDYVCCRDRDGHSVLVARAHGAIDYLLQERMQTMARGFLTADNHRMQINEGPHYHIRIF